MKNLLDCTGAIIRLTQERLAHILEHPEMADLESAIAETLLEPESVIESLSDKEARLYYRSYPHTRVGAKMLCVVVKAGIADAFVLTAYLTDARKKGRVLWPEKS